MSGRHSQPDAVADRTQVEEGASGIEGPGTKRLSRRQLQRSSGNGKEEDGGGAMNEEVVVRPDAGEISTVVDEVQGEGGAKSARRKRKPQCYYHART